MKPWQLNAVLVLLLLLSGPLLSQQHTHVSGLISDPSGAAVPGAAISVVSQDTGFRRTTQSSAQGWYSVSSLQPGFYKITLQKEGFRALIRFGVKLDAAQPMQLDFTLSLGSVQEVVTVRGTPPTINTDDASVGTLIRQEEIQNLPLNGRGLLSLLEFAPGTVVTPATRGESGQFSSSGQRPNANYFVVDGVSANTGVSGGGIPARSTGGSLPGMTAMGSFHGLVSLEALEEFRIQTSTATPEFGKLPGAQILLSSKSGSNDFHGSAFYYMRSGSLDANNWFTNSSGVDTGPTGMHDFGGTIGGPVRKNKTFFFTSYEGMRLQEPFTWRSPSPTAEIRESAPEWAQPVLGLFPVPNGPNLGPNLAEWNGQYDRESQFDVGSLRLDHAVTSRITVFGRYSLANSFNEFTSTQVNDLTIRSRSLTAGANVVLSPSAYLDFKMNYSSASGRSHWRTKSNLANTPCFLTPVARTLFHLEDSCDYMFRLSIAGVGQVSSGAEGDQRQTQWHLLPSATFSIRSHQIRVGMDHRRYAPERIDHNNSLSIIAEDITDFLSRPRLWVAESDARAFRSDLSEYSAFIQDTWRMHPRVTLTFGLRWEYAQAPKLAAADGFEEDPIAYAFDGQTEIWEQTHNNFAPRVGLAYKPIKGDRLVIRGGWGVFYDSTLSIATDLVNGGPFSLTQYKTGKNAPFSTLLSYGFAPGLKLPRVEQWNITVERGFGEHDALSVGYVGSTGSRLLRREFGGQNDGPLQVAVATNSGASSYHGLQAQYRRPMTRNLQVLASYAYAHSIDNSSTDALLHWVGPESDAGNDRGSSDFDVRQALTMAVTYETDEKPGAKFWGKLTGGWGFDGILRIRSGFPITPLDSEYSQGLGFANAFRPDLVPGQAIWLGDSSAPGGKRLNSEAFLVNTERQGTLGRNTIRGFGMSQVDFAARREFKITGRQSLLLRLEAFNLFNHPNFADPARFLSSPLFGESPSMLNQMLGTGSPGSGLTPMLQTGGARSMQVVLRYRF
jgi:carboxypeptidase family protein/TonB-dependent receptor-like protein